MFDKKDTDTAYIEKLTRLFTETILKKYILSLYTSFLRVVKSDRTQYDIVLDERNLCLKKRGRECAFRIGVNRIRQYRLWFLLSRHSAKQLITEPRPWAMEYRYLV